MRALQRSFEDLGAALVDVTFVAVDLETTGGVGPDSITEIGAVKMRGGEVLGEFATLVDPGCAIPPFITVLTGITDAMVIGAPRIAEALPAFLEFAGDAVLVAHNASFDSRFLSAEAERLGYGRLANRVVCTVRLARRLVRDEVPNLRLETLARALRGREPCHRALADARACADVFHALLEAAGRWGVTHLEDLLWFQTAGGHPQARKRLLADALPRGRGVYLFRDASGALLYVGKATDLRSRVRSYFTDERRRMGELLRELESVDHYPTRVEIETAVLEARLIRRHRPPYNRAQRGRLGGAWVRLTAERFPRVTVARTTSPGAIGPLPSSAARALREALEEAAPVRRCNDRIGPKTRLEPCALAAIGRCPAPCDGRVTPDDYGAALAPVADALRGAPTAALAAIGRRMERLSEEARYEEAASVRDRAFALATAVSRRRTASALTDAGRVVVDAGGVAVEIDGGTLVAVGGRALPVPCDGHPDEARLLWRWLSKDRTVRLMSAGGPLALPAAGGAAVAEWLARLNGTRRARSG